MSSTKKKILAIDLGTRYTKAAISEGNDLQIVKSIKAKDSIPTCVGIDEGKRYFGTMAETLAKAKPEKVVTNILLFVAAEYNYNLSKMTKVKTIENTLKRFSFQIEERLFTVTQLIALFFDGLFRYCKAKNDTHQIIIAVPHWWTPSHRQCIADAIKICDFQDFKIVSSVYCQLQDLFSCDSVVPNGIVIDAGETDVNVTLFRNRKTFIYDHYRIGSSDITAILGSYLFDILCNKFTEVYLRYTSNIIKDNVVNQEYTFEVQELKEKLATGISVKFNGYSITTQCEITAVVNCKEFEATPILIRPDSDNELMTVSNFIKKNIQPIDKAVSIKGDQLLFEVQGGFGCSDLFRQQVKSILEGYEITQRSHPRESIVRGAFQLASSDGKGFNIPSYFMIFKPMHDKNSERPILFENFIEIDVDKINQNGSDTLKFDRPGTIQYLIMNSTIDNVDDVFRRSSSRIDEELSKRTMMSQVSHTADPGTYEIRDIGNVLPIPFPPPPSSSYNVVEVPANTEIRVTVDRRSGVLSFSPILDPYGLSDEEIKATRKNIQQYIDADINKEKLDIAINNFQFFYFQLKAGVSRRKFIDYTDEMYEAVDRLQKDAEDWFQRNQNCKDEKRFNDKLKEFKERKDDIHVKLFINIYTPLNIRKIELEKLNPTFKLLGELNLHSNDLNDLMAKYTELNLKLQNYNSPRAADLKVLIKKDINDINAMMTTNNEKIRKINETKLSQERLSQISKRNPEIPNESKSFKTERISEHTQSQRSNENKSFKSERISEHTQSQRSNENKSFKSDKIPERTQSEELKESKPLKSQITSDKAQNDFLKLDMKDQKKIQRHSSENQSDHFVKQNVTIDQKFESCLKKKPPLKL